MVQRAVDDARRAETELLRVVELFGHYAENLSYMAKDSDEGSDDRTKVLRAASTAMNAAEAALAQARAFGSVEQYAEQASRQGGAEAYKRLAWHVRQASFAEGEGMLSQERQALLDASKQTLEGGVTVAEKYDSLFDDPHPFCSDEAIGKASLDEACSEVLRNFGQFARGVTDGDGDIKYDYEVVSHIGLLREAIEANFDEVRTEVLRAPIDAEAAHAAQGAVDMQKKRLMRDWAKCRLAVERDDIRNLRMYLDGFEGRLSQAVEEMCETVPGFSNDPMPLPEVHEQVRELRRFTAR